MEERMPLFLINGFLEAGKTEFLKFTMSQDYFQTTGKTLLIVCEEGENEYEEDFLKKFNTTMVVVDEQDQLTPEFLKELDMMHAPERVLMEWNGMWDITKLELPRDWELYQQITIVDGSTLGMYLNNNDLKSLLGVMVRNTELVIVNRCDGVEEEVNNYNRVIKGMNANVECVFESSDGELDVEILEEELPYDMKADIIAIPDDAYGIWYIDAMNNRERYEGKTFEFTAMVMKHNDFPKNYFVPGRMAMTCCAEDMSFLGFMCKAREARNLETKQWVRVTAKMAYEYRPEYQGEGPMLYADKVVSAKPIKDYVTF